jgi:hypothetical protein
MSRAIDSFCEVVLVDFEYFQADGGNCLLIPLCACAKELRSGREFDLWGEDLTRTEPPWAHGPDALFCSYNAPAELGCYLVLRWPLPQWILDLCIEHRQLVNGVLEKKMPRDLPSAMRYYGLSGIDAAEKRDWQKLILSGGPFDPEQRTGILKYCRKDIVALEALLPPMLRRMPQDLERALLRGRYTIPITETMRTGIPVDTDTWKRLYDHREAIQREVVANCPVYDRTTFKLDRFEQLLAHLGILDVWPRTQSGRISTADEAFRDFAILPEVENLRQIRQVIDHLRKPSFNVRGKRNYYGILPYKAETSRNATIGSLFQSPAWMRGLIQPSDGAALAYVDYEQEEFFIAGVLSKDEAILKAYASGDPYVGFAIESGLIPPGGNKTSHPKERALAKTLMLAVQYGMTSRTLAVRLGVSHHRAEDLLAVHRRVFRNFWQWSDEQVQSAYWTDAIETCYGWRLTVSPKTKERTIRNFRVQGDGAEILRLASLFLWERGVRVCAPVHDAFLVESAEQDVEDVVRETKLQMERASEYVLDGHRLRTEARVLRHPDRLVEPRGQEMWDRITAIAARLERDQIETGSMGNRYRQSYESRIGSDTPV